MQEQNQEAKKKLSEIYESLRFITLQSEIFNIKLELMKEKILVFFGFQHNEVDGLYKHFLDKSVIAENKYIKIVKLKKEEKVSYFINTPYSVEGLTDKDLLLDQCVTRIILNNILLQFKDCQYHIVLNYQKLQGQTQQEQLNYLTNIALLNFGYLVFKFKHISLIQKNDGEIKHCFVENIKKDAFTLLPIQKQEALKLILKTDKFKKIQNQKFQNFGPMSLFLISTMKDYVNQLNTILSKYQDQLLYLQQIPTLDSEQELNERISRLIRVLNQFFVNQCQSKLECTQLIFTILNFINQSYREALNSCLIKINIKLIKDFLNDKKITIEEMLIPDILVKEQEIEFINQMLKQFITQEFYKQDFNQIQNFQINLKCWDSYCSKKVESTIQNVKQTTQHIQEGPEEEREIGVFLFGKSRVDKSTLINLLQNPESLEIKKQIDQLCYVIKDGYQTEFNIEHDCMSETKKISSIKIGDIWFYDCPGFDDNISEQIRIAHRISLYNYLVKTKKVIVFFVIDSSIKDVQIIKDTIDPIYQLLKDKNQIINENNKWASLVLVKTEENTRKDYIEHWEQGCHGLLEGKYTFYREMFQNDNQCIEFPQPKKNLSSTQILNQNIQIKQKIFNRVDENRQNQGFKLNLDLQIDSKLQLLDEIVVSTLKIKIQQIVQLLQNQINTYILEDKDTLEYKKQLIQQFNRFIVDEINLQNVREILKQILDFCSSNNKFQNSSSFLQRTIDDVLNCLKLDEYCKNINIEPFKVNTTILKEIANKILDLINIVEKIELIFIIGGTILTISSVVVTCGIALLLESACAGSIVDMLIFYFYGDLLIPLGPTMFTLGMKSLLISFILNGFRQLLLRLMYEKYLKEVARQGRQ